MALLTCQCNINVRDTDIMEFVDLHSLGLHSIPWIDFHVFSYLSVCLCSVHAAVDVLTCRVAPV